METCKALYHGVKEGKNCPTLFQEFEKVMSNWKKHPLKTY